LAVWEGKYLKLKGGVENFGKFPPQNLRDFKIFCLIFFKNLFFE
jgi:hypothetical protein